MRDLIGSISINFLIVFSTVGLIYVYFLNIKGPKEKIGKFIIWLSPAFIEVFIMSNSYVLGNGNSIDFRYITLMFACLTGGFTAGLSALLAIILMAFIWIPDYLISATVVASIVYVTTGLLSTRYRREDFIGKKKLVLLYLLIFNIIILVSSYVILSTKDTLIVLLYMMMAMLMSVWSVSFLRFLDNLLYLKDQIANLEKLQMVSEMAASISHEIRNPLTSTRGFLQLIRENNISKEERTQFVDVAIDGIDRANAVLTDYLTFAKPSTSDSVCIKLIEEIPKALNLIYPLALKNHVEVEYYVGKGTLELMGAPTKLRQCILNLLKNAVEAMPNGGKLYIHVLEENNELCINISDTGKGMTANQLKNLGRAYFTTKENGTGLGLMSVYHIVDKMQGRINVYSTLGLGTKFSLTFPLYNHYKL